MCPLRSCSLSISHSFTQSLCSTCEAQGHMKWRFIHLMLHHWGPNPSTPPFPMCLGSRLTLWTDLILALRCHEREFPHPTSQSWKWMFLWIHYKLHIAFDLDLPLGIEKHPENLSLGVKECILTSMTRVLTHFFRMQALWDSVHPAPVISNMSSLALPSHSESHVNLREVVDKEVPKFSKR